MSSDVLSRLTLQELRVWTAVSGGLEVSIERLWLLARSGDPVPESARLQQQQIGAIVANINKKLPLGQVIRPGATPKTYQLRRL